MIFYGYEPFGYEIGLYGHGIVASTLANIHRKKGAKATNPEDFIPKHRENDIEQTIGFVASLNQTVGGKDLR